MSDDLSKLSIDKSARDIHLGRRKKNRVYYAGLILVVMIIGFLYHKGFLTPAVTVVSGNVSLIYPSQSISLLNASGYVVAQRKAAVASKITGRLIELLVEEGSLVQKGQVIAKLENDDVLAGKAQAEANLKAIEANLRVARVELQDAELNFNRSKKLIASNSISQFEYDASEIRFRKAKASVEAAAASVKAQAAAVQSACVALDYTLIKAPFDAVVLTKNADVGDIVTPIGAASDAKSAVVTIADMNSFLVEVDVSETNISMVKVGQPCEIMLDAIPDVRLRGEVHMIVPTVDRSKATIMVKAAFLDKDARMFPNMSVKVAFLSRTLKNEEKIPRLAVNESALVKREGIHIVFLIQNNEAIEKPVRTGEKLGDMVEIKDGLKSGDKVVIKPDNNLKNRTKIKVEEK